MANQGTRKSAESSGTGLTFVRPLLQVRNVSPATADDSGSRPTVLSLMERLFPPQSWEDSGSLPPVTGLELGHFVIEERIGRGGMGAVFRALDRRLDRVVALKVLSPGLSVDPEAVQRFQNEARAAARLDHDNIARVHYIGEEHGLHFIAFEFVTGTNVRNFILQKGKLNPADAVNYTLQIAEALRHTAAANVVHRDIKPSNIIVAPTGRAKLVDLGLARSAASDQALELTMAGTALGTFDYIAPEQAIDARKVDVRSDIYSLGCTLYHMLAGEPPYPKGTMFEKVMNHHRPVPPDASLKNPRVSPQLARVIQKMMASNPDERYATPDNLISDLIQIAESLGLQPAVPDAAIWTTPLFSRRNSYWDGTRTWMAVALVLLLLVFLVDKLPRTTAVTASQPSLPVETLLPGSPEPVVPVESDNPVLMGATPPAATLATKPANAAIAPPPPPRGDVLKAFRQAAVDALTIHDAMIGHSSLASDVLTLSNTLSTRPPAAPGLEPIPNSEAGETIPEPLIAAEPFAVLVTGEPPRRVATLAAACKIAADQAVIEIQMDGPLDVQQESLLIANKRIKIRPAPDCRPVLRFDLSNQLSMRSFSRTAEMIQVHKGELELYDIDVEMVVDEKSVVDQWAMVSLSRGGEFIARGVSLTFINPGQLPAALFHIPPAESSENSLIMRNQMPPRGTTVQLNECICRGQSDFAFLQNVPAASFQLQSVAVALSGVLFRIDGTTDFAMAMETDEMKTVAIRLDHVTAMTGEGLIHATSGEHGSLPRIDLDLHDCLFRVDHANRPFVFISGHEDYDTLSETLNWNRSADPSFFQLTGPVYLLESSTSFFDDPLERSPEECGIAFEQLVTQNLIELPGDIRATALHRVQPRDFSLRRDEGFSNPALNAAGDGQNAGVDWFLPRIPATLPR